MRWGQKTTPLENVVFQSQQEDIPRLSGKKRQTVRQKSPLLYEEKKEDVPDWLKQVAPEEDKPEVRARQSGKKSHGSKKKSRLQPSSSLGSSYLKTRERQRFGNTS